MTGNTILEIIKLRAQITPNAVAVLGLGRKPLSYGRLYDHILLTVKELNDLGIGRNDRVAVVLPNGPLMAVAFVSIASVATFAPLNPSYTTPEFEYYLSDLSPKALIVLNGMESPARNVAQAKRIPIIELISSEDESDGLFTLIGEQNSPSDLRGPAHASDIALMLHTSGTTSRPKIVPLTHNNLCSSAEAIRKVLELTQADSCLNIMPLFHIHGLVAATLSSLNAGASVICTPGFLAPEFFKWVAIFQPTWYTAVPSMHQAILGRASRHEEVITRFPLRFIRSSSSSLSPVVMQKLEAIFGVPVIEAYGMTEASHQMASNPLPPASRKAGSVGLPAGPEIAIMNEERPTLLPFGTKGEIVIRGPSVILGYANNPEANLKAFDDGWFRTGDQGYIDEEGYLFITGRLKEIINRGGEKISPREIDEIILAHPAVVQAVTFGIPDESLGEDVAVAVVLNENAVSEAEIRNFAAGRLALFKVPRRVFILDEIPKGATGKIQRIGLAAKLGLSNVPNPSSIKSIDFLPPRSSIEKTIEAIWCQVLDRPKIGVKDDFRTSGGDSMLATVIHMQIEQKLKIKVPLVDLYSASTIAEQAALIENLFSENSKFSG